MLIWNVFICSISDHLMRLLQFMRCWLEKSITMEFVEKFKFKLVIFQSYFRKFLTNFVRLFCLWDSSDGSRLATRFDNFLFWLNTSAYAVLLPKSFRIFNDGPLPVMRCLLRKSFIDILLVEVCQFMRCWLEKSCSMEFGENFQWRTIASYEMLMVKPVIQRYFRKYLTNFVILLLLMRCYW